MPAKNRKKTGRFLTTFAKPIYRNTIVCIIKIVRTISVIVNLILQECNSVNLIKNYFSFKGRMGRREYFLIQIAYAIIETTLSRRFSIAGGSLDESLFWLVTFLVSLPLVVKRFHDCDVSVKFIYYLVITNVLGFFSWHIDTVIVGNFARILQGGITLISLVVAIKFLMIVFKRGTEGENQHGPRPEEFSLGVRFTYAVWIVAALIVAISIKTYDFSAMFSYKNF